MRRAVWICLLLGLPFLFPGCGGPDILGPAITLLQSGPPAETPSRVAFRLVLPGISSGDHPPSSVRAAEGFPKHSPAVAAGEGNAVSVSFRLITFDPTQPENPFRIQTKTVTVGAGGKAEASFSDIPCVPIVGRVEITNGNVGGYAWFHGGAVLEPGLNQVDLAPVGSGMDPDLKASILLAAAVQPGLLGKLGVLLPSQLESAIFGIERSGGDPVSQSFEALVKEVGTYGSAASRLESLPDATRLSCIKPDGTWQKDRTQLLGGLDLGGKDVSLLRLDRVFLAGSDGFGVAGWSSTDGGFSVVSRIALATGGVTASFLCPGASPRLAFLPGGMMIGVFNPVSGFPVLYRWNGSGNARGDGDWGTHQGTAWRTPFPDIVASGTGKPRVEFLRVLDSEHFLFGVFDPRLGLRTFSVDSLTGDATGYVSSLSLRVSGVAASGAVQLAWDPIPEADSYSVFWATASEGLTASGAGIVATGSPVVVSGLKNGIPHFFIVRANAPQAVISESLRVIPMPPNHTPSAEFLGPYQLQVNSTGTFFIRPYDPDFDQVSVEWLGNGGTWLATGATSAIWLSPGVPGNISVSARVTDSNGASVTATIKVNVASFAALPLPPAIPVNVASGGTVMDTQTGLTFVFPRGSAGEVQVQRLTEMPIPPREGMEGFILSHTCSGPIALRLPAVDDDHVNELHIFGPAFNPDHRTTGWNVIPSYRSDGTGEYFEIPQPSSQVQQSIRALSGRFRPLPAGKEQHTVLYFILRQRAMREQEEKDLRNDVYSLINGVLGNLPPDIRAAASATLELLGGFPSVVLSYGEDTSSYVGMATHNLPLVGWTLWESRKSIFSFYRPWNTDLTARIPRRTIIHEVGHCINHLLAGDRFNGIARKAEQNHGIGDLFTPRKTITDDYAFFFELLNLDSVSPIGADPLVSGFRAKGMPMTTAIYSPRYHDPRKIDLPSVEGYGCTMMALATRGGPKGPDIFGTPTVQLPPILSASRTYSIFQSGATNVNELVDALLREQKKTVVEGDLAGLLGQFGWNYRVSGTVVNKRGKPIPGVTLKGVLTTSGGNLETSSAETDSAGQFKGDRFFPGSYSVQLSLKNGYYYNSQGGASSVFVDWTKPTNEVNNLSPILLDMPSIDSVTPSTFRVGDQISVTGTHFDLIPADSVKLMHLCSNGTSRGLFPKSGSVTSTSLECVTDFYDDPSCGDGTIFVNFGLDSGSPFAFSTSWPVTILPSITQIFGAGVCGRNRALIKIPPAGSNEFAFFPGGEAILKGWIFGPATGTVSCGTIVEWKKGEVKVKLPSTGTALPMRLTNASGTATSEPFVGTAVDMNRCLGSVGSIGLSFPAGFSLCVWGNITWSSPVLRASGTVTFLGDDGKPYCDEQTLECTFGNSIFQDVTSSTVRLVVRSSYYTWDDKGEKLPPSSRSASVDMVWRASSNHPGNDRIHFDKVEDFNQYVQFFPATSPWNYAY